MYALGFASRTPHMAWLVDDSKWNSLNSLKIIWVEYIIKYEPNMYLFA